MQRLGGAGARAGTVAARWSAHNPVRVALLLPVRADGAPGAAPEVQGLGARGSVVPREPAGVDGRLRTRVLDSAQGRDRPGLRAVPHRRPDRLGLLLPGPAGRGPEPG